ncbi:hypothetical protein DFA_07916 [Cavenderia fasciculata]|uniref:Uncharacterized protein n=1 Tax=Cavenderia fasciculata TaxID=261658 RepID=F4Q421_CACFS|nr:uncharacterized protein DFA_07916 [Cavenderia fasciculata]EGG16935.1 hypothetical protein DFA_07916 [Cavenderia fasciculata]|eukprot:XP_004355409.1 hypothetical protein DFA_07916 [Cavenderia fasciculata]
MIEPQMTAEEALEEITKGFDREKAEKMKAFFEPYIHRKKSTPTFKTEQELKALYQSVGGDNWSEENNTQMMNN